MSATRKWILVTGTVTLFLLAASGVCQTPDAAAKFRLAQGLEQAAEYERAAAVYGELAARDLSNPVYFDGLQRTLMQLKRYDEVAGLIRQRLQRTPADVSLRSNLGSVLYKAGKEQEAMEAWNAALNVDASNPNIYRVVASVMVENRLLDRAAEVYRRGRTAAHDPHLFTLELAQLLVASMDYAGATEEYLGWLSQNPGQLAFVENRLATFSWKPDGRASAISVVTRTAGERNDVHLQDLLGWLYLEGKEFDRAFEVYRAIDRLSGSDGTNLLGFADRALHDGAYEVAARAYQEALHASIAAPRVPQALYGYATALNELSMPSDTAAAPASGAPPSPGDVIAQFKEIIRRYPHSEYSARARYQVGMIMFKRMFDLHGALESFAQIGREDPAPPALQYEVALRTGDVLTAKGDTAGAAERYRSVAARPDATPDQADEAQFRLAELDYFAGRFADASRRLGDVTVNPKADYANDALALGALLDENSTTAAGALAAFARANMLSRQRKDTEAIALLTDVITRYPQAPLLDDALMSVAALQTHAGLYQNAVRSYERLLGQFKESSVSLDRAEFFLAQLYETALKDKERAVGAYERLLASHPGSVLANQARRRIRQLRGETP